MVEKHKVFVSYYHKDDEKYRNRFEKLFGDLFISKSVEPGDIDTDVSADYIKRLIQKDYISDASVIIVLVGAKTYCRKHVDWEISAALSEKAGGYSGLLGLCLPTHPNHKKNYNQDVVPSRFVDNLKSGSGYANFYDWTEDEQKIKKCIERAFQDRVDKVDKIDNSRVQMKKNICD